MSFRSVRPHRRAPRARGSTGRRPRLGHARALLRQDRLRRAARRHRHLPDRVREEPASAGGVGAVQGAHHGDVRRDHGRSARRAPRARRLRDRRHRSHDHRSEPDRLSDPAEGARHRLPARQPALLAALAATARDCGDPQRDRAGDPRLLLRARLSARRYADSHGGHRRADPGCSRRSTSTKATPTSRRRASSMARPPRRRSERSTPSARPSAPRSRRRAATSPSSG